MVDVE
jgi:hypothetical protein